MDIVKLRDLLLYDQLTGKLYWKERPGDTRFNKRFAGKEAFTSTLNSGYKQGEMFGKGYLAHRVSWALHNGHWPEQEIDHINGDRADNRIDNLRKASRKNNGRNLRLKSSNTSGVCGVNLDKASGKWRARVKFNGVEINLGLHADKDEARLAVEAKRAELGFKPEHGEDKMAPRY